MLKTAPWKIDCLDRFCKDSHICSVYLMFYFLILFVIKVSTICSQTTRSIFIYMLCMVIQIMRFYGGQISWHLQYIKALKFEKLTIPEFRAIFGLLKYHKINFEKTFWTKKAIREYWAIFGLFKKVYIDFWAPTLNIKMHPCMAMVTRLWLKIIFLGTL